MTPPPMVSPMLDPTRIFEIFRGNHGTELLTAAVAHFKVFDRLEHGPLTFDQLRLELGLADRPAVVLVTALRAFGLLADDEEGRIGLTELARDHLTPGAFFDVSGYVGLAAEAPGVVEMIERLRTNRPAGAAADEEGAAFIFKPGIESAMETEASARSLTLALAGRARNVAPVLAEKYPLEDARLLVDVGGGTGIYSIAWLLRHPHLRAIVWDRPEVLKVAVEMAESFGVADRLEARAGDMFQDDMPEGADVILLSNILHDWDVVDGTVLVARCASALRPGGRLLIHDVFLNDALDGPLPIALYSAALFRLTEGRAYSAGEYRGWMNDAGIIPGEVIPTLIHCGVLPGVKVTD
ncbi:methyltransferase [Tundrisphaera lichenicola]|uniref:methyltransferase n=1 Tax=Tundrisphaera lichenicola TaxID=2029860 RepID=UPI003EB6C2DC